MSGRTWAVLISVALFLGACSSKRAEVARPAPQPPPAPVAESVPAPPPAPAAPAAPMTPRLVSGYVVYVDGSQIVIDLTARDGITRGLRVSLRREGPALKHPVTGKPLGNLEEELGTGTIAEIRDKYSLVRVDELKQGASLKPKDRVEVNLGQ